MAGHTRNLLTRVTHTCMTPSCSVYFRAVTLQTQVSRRLPAHSCSPAGAAAAVSEYMGLVRSFTSSQAAAVAPGSKSPQHTATGNTSQASHSATTNPTTVAPEGATPSGASAAAAPSFKPDLFTQHMQHKTEQQLRDIIQHSRDQKLADAHLAEDDKDQSDVNPVTGEQFGPKGPEPTRHGDWEFKGRCTDF